MYETKQAINEAIANDILNFGLKTDIEKYPLAELKTYLCIIVDRHFSDAAYARKKQENIDCTYDFKASDGLTFWIRSEIAATNLPFDEIENHLHQKIHDYFIKTDTLTFWIKSEIVSSNWSFDEIEKNLHQKVHDCLVKIINTNGDA